jgi:D-alanine-D-alanine ligase
MAEKKRKKITVALLTGGISNEAYLSRRSCATVCKELDRDRYDIFILDWQQQGTVKQSALNRPEQWVKAHTDIIACFADFSGDLVFNTLHGELENSGQIQGLLELAKIPLTGNGITASVLGMNKQKCKDCFASLAVPCPRGVLLPAPDVPLTYKVLQQILSRAGLRLPLILKPVSGGSSDGIHLIRNVSELTASLELINHANRQRPFLMEEFHNGREISVGIFCFPGQINCSRHFIMLPVAEILYEGVFFDKEIKHEEQYQLSFPDDLSPELLARLKKAAHAIHCYLGLQGFSRTDFILTDSELFALEVNTHPGMSSSSIIPGMVAQAGLSLGNLYGQMIDYSLIQTGCS